MEFETSFPQRRPITENNTVTTREVELGGSVQESQEVLRTERHCVMFECGRNGGSYTIETP
jgi:hypothetical protein